MKNDFFFFTYKQINPPDNEAIKIILDVDELCFKIISQIPIRLHLLAKSKKKLCFFF